MYRITLSLSVQNSSQESLISHGYPSHLRDLCLGGEAKTRSLGVENDVLALEEDITEDGEAKARVALDTTEAGGAAGADGSVVDVLAGNNGVIVTNGDSEVRQISRAREDVATLGLAVLGPSNLSVVGGDNRVREQEKGGTSVYMISRDQC